MCLELDLGGFWSGMFGVWGSAIGRIVFILLLEQMGSLNSP